MFTPFTLRLLETPHRLSSQKTQNDQTYSEKIKKWLESDHLPFLKLIINLSFFELKYDFSPIFVRFCKLNLCGHFEQSKNLIG